MLDGGSRIKKNIRRRITTLLRRYQAYYEKIKERLFQSIFKTLYYQRYRQQGESNIWGKDEKPERKAKNCSKNNGTPFNSYLNTMIVKSKTQE